jgi:hypothetical protein
VAATGKRVEFRSMVFNRFSNGIVVENWGSARPRASRGTVALQAVGVGAAQASADRKFRCPGLLCA